MSFLDEASVKLLFGFYICCQPAFSKLSLLLGDVYGFFVDGELVDCDLRVDTG